jgi:hypothetical protein
MDKVNPRQNFGANRFDYPSIIETSIGPVWLTFTENEPGDPPMINALDVAHWFSQLGLPANHHLAKVTSKANLYTTFHFIGDGGWRPNKGATMYEVDNVKTEIPQNLQDELAGHMAKWARDNQERFIRHERAQFFEQLADYSDMLDDAIEENGEPSLSVFCGFNDELDALIHSRWAQLVPPGAVEMVKQASAAIVKIQDGIREAQAAFKAIAEHKPCE